MMKMILFPLKVFSFIANFVVLKFLIFKNKRLSQTYTSPAKIFLRSSTSWNLLSFKAVYGLENVKNSVEEGLCEQGG